MRWEEKLCFSAFASERKTFENASRMNSKHWRENTNILFASCPKVYFRCVLRWSAHCPCDFIFVIRNVPGHPEKEVYPGLEGTFPLKLTLLPWQHNTVNPKMAVKMNKVLVELSLNLECSFNLA